jgi:DNA-binding response OmpR family regulator
MDIKSKAAVALVEAKGNSPRRILVVDDDHETRQLSVDVLIDAGYDVESAKDGAAGWEVLQVKVYDLVITDNHMPRLTGMEMIAKLRSAHMPVSIILATGTFPANIIAHNPWLKPDASIQRPCSNDDLVAMVKKILPQEPITPTQSSPAACS